MGNEENKTLYDIYRGILCNNQSFQLGKQAQVEYRFDCPEYAELKEKYHLNEIAGNGTELEHSVRLLKYLAPKLTHSAWYDNSVPCNGLALLEYSLSSRSMDLLSEQIQDTGGMLSGTGDLRPESENAALFAL